MKSLNIVALSALAFSFSISAVSAGGNPPFEAPDHAATPRGFGTNAKVALLWHWSEGAIRSVGVSKVIRADKGVICVVPKVALDAKGIFPLVSVSPEESNTLAGFAGSRSQSELCPSDKDIEIDTYEATKNGASPSNNVGFFLIVE